MEPQQFKEFDRVRDLKDYDPSWLEKSQEEQDDFIHDDFITMCGSNHSIYNCSCTPVSEAYGIWFRDNKIHLLWDEIDKANPRESRAETFNIWELYEQEVKKRCDADGITFEGF